MEFGAYVCSHIFENTRPILLVSRADGDWQFLCGKADHPVDEVPRLVGINHLVERDPTLAELSDLPEDWEAERVKVGDVWQKVDLRDLP